MNKPSADRLIAYRWALDSNDYPIPITRAQRGERYHCPLCQGLMVARLGEQLQHHFGHETDAGCTPEAVTRAAVRRWVSIQLRNALDAKQTMMVQWDCKRCGKHHSGDLLGGVAFVLEGYLWDKTHFADVGMQDMAGNVSAIILIQDDEVPSPDTLSFFTAQPIITITIPASITPAESDFATILTQGQIIGAPCPMLQSATNIIQEPDTIREALRTVVERWPGYFYGPLETIDGLADVLRIGNRNLWLPSDQWRDVIGGTRNPLGSGVQVTMQTWPHSDGGTIWLYYATVRNTAAVGVRRYGPSQTPVAYIDARFRQTKTTALDIVKYMVTQ